MSVQNARAQLAVWNVDKASMWNWRIVLVIIFPPNAVIVVNIIFLLLINALCISDRGRYINTQLLKMSLMLRLATDLVPLQITLHSLLLHPSFFLPPSQILHSSRILSFPPPIFLFLLLSISLILMIYSDQPRIWPPANLQTHPIL